MSQGASFISSEDPENQSRAEIRFSDFQCSTISHQRYELDSSSVLSSNGPQIEMQQGLNEHLTQGSFISAKRRESEAGNREPMLSNRDNTCSVVSGTFYENKESVLTDNIRRTMDPKNIKVIEEKEEEDGESTEQDSDSDRSAKKIREQFAVPLEMANISSDAITPEKMKRLERLRGEIRKRSGKLIEWQRSWSYIVLKHRKLGQQLWKKLEEMLKETIRNIKKNQEKLKNYNGNQENILIKKEIICEIEEIIEALEKGLALAKGKYEHFTCLFRFDEKLENAVKTLQEGCEGFLKSYKTIEGGLYTAEMRMIFQVQNQVNIEEGFGKIMTKILEGVKEIEKKEYKRFSEIALQRKIFVEELQIEYENNVEEFIKKRYLPKNLVDFEGKYEDFVEYLGSIKFNISKEVEKNSLLLYNCQGFYWEKKKKIKENAVRFGLSADGWIVVFEIDRYNWEVKRLNKWGWSDLKLEEHRENENMIVIGNCCLEFEDALEKKGFLSRFEEFKI